jgi:diguanylate cyclase
MQTPMSGKLHGPARDRWQIFIKACGVPALVFFLGVAVSAYWRNAAVEDAKGIVDAKFDANVQRIHRAVQDRMLAHEQVLLGCVGLFDTVGTVTRAQWSSYVDSLQLAARYPGIQGIGYAALVRPADTHSFVTGLRAQGLPGYAIRPVGMREAYAPVTYLEPRSERNLKALGFDMLSEPVRKTAMRQAGESGMPAVTAKLRLASEGSQSSAHGFLVYLPVYKKNLPLDTPERRMAAVAGFVNSPVRMEDLLKGTLDRNTEEISFKIFDGTSMAAESLMYQDTSMGSSDKPVERQLVKYTILPFSNHAWTLAFSTPSALTGRDSATANLILLCGVLVSLVLAIASYAADGRVRSIRKSEQHYFRLANYDSLTGLANRSMFLDRLERSLLQAERDRCSMALVFIDVDHFKTVNDRLGHSAGDAVLQEVAARLRACIRKADTLARLGGDEFTAILCNVKHASDAATVARNILDRMALPLQIEGKACHISVSLGIALYPEHATSADGLLKCADQAMYTAKHNGRGQLQFFSPVQTDA